MRKRVARLAFLVVLAANESLERARVLRRDELLVEALRGARRALPHHDVGLVIRGAIRIDALDARLAAEGGHLDLGHAALGTLLFDRFNLALRQRIRHIALRPTGAANEHRTRFLARAQLQVFAALRARSHVCVGSNSIGQSIFDLLLMRQKLIEHIVQDVARQIDHVFLGLVAGGNLVHIFFERRRHVGARDLRCELTERIAYGNAELAWLDRVVLHVFHRVKALDDRMARGLGAQAQALHFLNELALAVARRRLGLLLGAYGALEIDRLAFDKSGQLLFFLHAVRVNGAEARLHNDVAAHRERLGVHFDGHLRAFDDGSVGKGCQETASDEVIELPLRRAELIGVGGSRGVDRRMVGRFLLAARGNKLAALQQLLAIRTIGRNVGELFHRAFEVERFGIHRVVDTRIGNIAVHVQAFSQAHGACGRKALARGGGHKRRGIERYRSSLRALFLLDGGNHAGSLALNVGHNGIRGLFALEASRRMRCAELIGSMLEVALDHPIVLGNKRHALAFASDDERERRGLHAARAAHVAVTSEFHDGEVAREHRAPNEVDFLAALARRGQILIELHEIREGVRDFFFRDGRIARTEYRRGIVHLFDLAERVRTDELAFAVEVGRDNDFVGLLGQVLQAADDVFFLRQLLDGRICQIRQRVHLPRAHGDAIGQKRLALGFVRRFREKIGNIGRHDFAIGGHALPALRFLVDDLRNEIGLENMAAQADGYPFFAIEFKTVDGRVVNLVGLRLFNAQQIGDFLGGDILLSNDELQSESSRFLTYI